MKLGFIGAGNMATAILKGVIGKGFLPPEEIAVFDVSPAQCDKLAEQFPLHVAESQEELIAACDVILLAVKPIYLKRVLEKAKPLASGKDFISIAAGWTFAMLTDILDEQSGARVLRTMPNTPAMVGAGFTALCEQTTLTDESFAWAMEMFKTLGEVAVLPESLFDAVVAVTGSSPAYVFMFIEAMADGAVKLGMPRALAYRAAAQAVLGSAKMVLDTDEHPAKLKDMVCSPGGTTIDAVASLERDGMRSAIIDAMSVCAQKSYAMGHKEPPKA
ncbi:MAG TPA: pyrroline-5-carboxylate reductase [Candidatus Limiplasma sp.]|nr:pyrroline-5-carboxylate reductase [Candidatus Limiplasma sp.]HPS81134.1 pyrroline-5-carboxylate reductase [Candidatus Limiplasma sp.]